MLQGDVGVLLESDVKSFWFPLLRTKSLGNVSWIVLDILPRKLTWQWKIYQDIISYWTWGVFKFRFQICIFLARLGILGHPQRWWWLRMRKWSLKGHESFSKHQFSRGCVSFREGFLEDLPDVGCSGFRKCWDQKVNGSVVGITPYIPFPYTIPICK